MTGTIVNAAAIGVGTVIGLLLKRGISDSFKNTVMQGIGLAVLLVGGRMALEGTHILVIIFSLTLGGVCGELIGIENKLERIGIFLERRIGANGGNIAAAFVSTSLIFCVGAMAVVGAIEDGLTGNTGTLYAKSVLDGVISIFFASTMGIGVIFSEFSVLLYQGTITLLASSIKDILNPFVISQLTSTGGLLIVGAALNILEIKKIKVGNLLPSVLIVMPLAYYADKFSLHI